MNRILKLHVNDILADPAKLSETVNDACSHGRHMKLTGCCEIEGGVLVLSFEETAAPTPLRHVFAEFPGSSEDDVVDEINSRYTYGFTTLASFRAGGKLWGLFSHDPKAPSVHPKAD